MTKSKVTVKELAKILGLTEWVVRTHLCRFEKYRIPRLRPFTYIYNYPFLLELRDFYFEKSQSLGKKYESYGKVVTRLDKIINLWVKKIRANLC